MINELVIYIRFTQGSKSTNQQQVIFEILIKSSQAKFYSYGANLQQKLSHDKHVEFVFINVDTIQVYHLCNTPIRLFTFG